MLLSETVKAFPTFSEPLNKVRHIEPNSDKAKDARLGYMMAIGWSLFVATAIHQSTSADNVYLLWAVTAGSMVLYYEWALNSDG